MSAEPATPEYSDFFESLEFQVRCALIHRDKANHPGTCLEPGIWVGRLHRCATPEGSLTVFCQWFLDKRVNTRYPLECLGCGQIFETFVDMVWDFYRL